MPSLTGQNFFVISCHSTGGFKKRGEKEGVNLRSKKKKKSEGKNPRKEKEISCRFYNPLGIKPKERKPKTFVETNMTTPTIETP